ncbi:hypothetical protein [Streptomyces parvus]|nr:hypothetical protein [Streptomyces parvus]
MARPWFGWMTECAAHSTFARGTFEVGRGLLRHTLYLEEVTHQQVAEWLAYRHCHWPASTNPHLLDSRKTAPGFRPVIRTGTLCGVLP